MSTAGALPPELRGRVFRGTDAVSSGAIGRSLLRGPAVHRLFRDCFADSSLPVDHVLRCRALGLVLPPGAVLVGVSAAAMHGVQWVEAEDPVHVAVPHPHPWGARTGVVVSRAQVRVAEITVQSGIRVATRERVLLDLAARPVEPAESMVLVDAALARWPVLERQREDLLAGWAGRRGCHRARAVLALADGRSQSPMESRLRAHLLLGGLPPAEAQWVVRDHGGRFVARVDLAWPDRCLAVEYDGRWHGRTDEQFSADRRRLDALTAAGWRVVHVTRVGVDRGWPEVVHTIRQAWQQTQRPGIEQPRPVLRSA